MQTCTLIPDSRESVHPHLFTRYMYSVGAVRVAVRVALNSPVASVEGYRSHTTHSMKAQLHDIVH